MLDRRKFAKTVAGAAIGAAALAVPDSLSAEPAAEKLPFKLSIMLWTIYRDMPFEKRLDKVVEAGYHAVELVGEFSKWSDADFRNYNNHKRSLGITFDATAGIHTSLVDPKVQDAFLEELGKLMDTADRLECPAIIVLTGNRIESMERQAQHDACVEALKRASDLAEKKNKILLLENIDPEENPKYYLTSVAEGFEIVRKINHPRVRFLYDFFHEQISEGNLIEKLEKNIDYVGLVHVADVPGRHDPGTGEINYPSIYRKLAELKYDRYAAMEFLPNGDPVAALKKARAMVAQSVSG